jgi:hypothetical protein
MMQRQLAVLALVALAVATAVPTGATPTAAPGTVPTTTPAPTPSASPQFAPSGTAPSDVLGTLAPATPPTVAPAVPVSTAGLEVFTGQLLDIRSGYAFFTTGDAFKITPNFRVVDYFTGKPTPRVPGVKIFAKATLDPKTATIIELAITTHYVPPDKEYASVAGFAAKDSPFSLAPELNGGPRLTGRSVSVEFEVTVPTSTAITDSVYISTDQSGWVANAYQMDRVDSNTYRLRKFFASGTKFAWKVTRGAWATQEVGPDGADISPRNFLVKESDVQKATATVAAWQDQNGSQKNAGPNGIPTPFNPNPFASLPPNPRGPAQPQSTLAPNGLPPGCPTATTGACAPPTKK